MAIDYDPYLNIILGAAADLEAEVSVARGDIPVLKKQVEDEVPPRVLPRRGAPQERNRGSWKKP